MCMALSNYGDVLQYSNDEEARQEAEDRLALLTPIAKAFLTESGLEAANHGVQVFGGHGYISEWGMEQIVRDTRIATLYEGTTGVQALDLLGRKVLMSRGELLRKFTREIHEFCKLHQDHVQLGSCIEKLAAVNKEWLDVTTELGMRAMQNRDEVGAASVDYLMYSGYITLSYYWLRMAVVAHQKLEAELPSDSFYKAKIQTAIFCVERLLPRTEAHKACMRASLGSLMDMCAQDFYLD
jgi:Acetyl-CoA dehydrogenase C-terminal like/Acyl-CoA dehydrogenase, C-terminal domain